MPITASPAKDSVLYHVQPGDNLSKIIKNYYGAVGIQQQQVIIKEIMADNPFVTNPSVIYPGQALIIDIPTSYKSPAGKQTTPTVNADKKDLKPLVQKWQKGDKQEQSFYAAMSPYLLGTGSAGLTMIETNFKTNAPIVAKIAELYNQYKEGKITKGQYDGRRASLLQQLKTKLGPTQRILSGGKPANEILRISRTKGATPTVNINQQVSKMTSISKYASRGGVVLSAAGLGISCYNIANTDDRHKKNEILVESVGALGGGLVYGGVATLTIVLMATPVGWLGALAIGIGGALTGAAAGVGTKYLYNSKFKHVDVAKLTKVDQVCR